MEAVKLRRKSNSSSHRGAVKFYFGSGRGSSDDLLETSDSYHNVEQSYVERIGRYDDRDLGHYTPNAFMFANGSLPPGSHRQSSALEYSTLNETAMISCWTRVHGSPPEVNSKDLRNRHNGFLRSMSFINDSSIPEEDVRFSRSKSFVAPSNRRPSIGNIGNRSRGLNSLGSSELLEITDDMPENVTMAEFNRQDSGYCPDSDSSFNQRRTSAEYNGFQERRYQRRDSGFYCNRNSMNSDYTSNNEKYSPQGSRPQRHSTGQPYRQNIGHKSLERTRSRSPLGGQSKPPTEKSAAYRQSSYPGLREQTLIKNESKRCSMPLPVVYQDMKDRMALSDDWSCDHVEELSDSVPELFHCIRGATQRDIFEEMEPRVSESPKACYEVMYVGRAKVRGKKILSSHIDDLVMRLEAKDRKNSISNNHGNEVTDRRRHKSDSSVKSLPSVLDSGLVMENELQKMSHTTIFQGVELHNEAHSGSHDDVHKTDSNENLGNQRSDSTDHLSDGGHSSNENVTDTHTSSDMLKDMIHEFHHHPEGQGHMYGHDEHGNQRSTNRTMLFRIGQNEIALISLDKKQTLIERKFKNISSVSQGNLKPDVFGFISREPGSHLLCHLLRGYSNDVVDEIMGTLKTSFQNAYQQSRLQTQQICINCPLHQYHKLCQDINGLQPEAAYNVLCKRIQNLPEKDADDLYHSLQNGNPQCHEESVEALMIAIRKLCEHKQREHSHISDSSKGSHKPDICLMEMKDKGGKSAFDFLRNRAKKKLTSSFETLFTNVHHKTEEVREAFRHRSGTNESEGGSFSRSVDYTSDASPAPSPAFHTKDQANFDFPSPPPSPNSRPRSSTVGAVPDTGTLERMKARQEEREKAEKKELEKRRTSESPMKHMFILANTGSPLRHSPGHTRQGNDDDDVSSDNVTPKRIGSWRQAIFQRVVTPAKHSSTPTLDESEEICDGESSNKKSKEELRALWRKAILETLLLIRMEKENQDLQARQDEVDLKRQKLDYVEITPCLKDVTKSWDEMLARNSRETHKVDPDTLLDCVRKGVPQAKRGEIWWFLVEQHHLKHPNIEENTPKVDYHDLLKQLTNHQHAILIDLGRTFPGHPYFSTQLGSGQLALFNLLKAYSLMDHDVGYCQGLSFVAGILLMHMEETVAFEAWKHVMYNLGLRKQYRPNMIALQIQLYQLTRLLHDNYKDLYDHFEIHEIAPTLYAAPWFLTLFASQFPLGFVARVFDLIFIQGSEVIFKVALVLLGNHKELIIQCNSFETIMEFIKTTLPEMGMIQMERVINQVFDLDVSKQLQSYEVEYHVLKEEMMYSPQKGDSDLLTKLEQANRSLKQQNMELIEKLQNAHSHERSLEIMIHNFQMQETKLKSHIRTLEIERQALLNAVTKLKQYIPEAKQNNLDISLPVLTPSLPCSPVHHGYPVGIEHAGIGLIKTDEGAKVQQTTEAPKDKPDMSKSARIHPERESQ
ncbi:domain member [Mactra antiquata]